jgi:NAD(P)H-dependent FMN reductase
MHVAVVLGTARTGRESEKVARAVVGHLETMDDTEVEFVDVREQLKEPTTIAPWDENATHGSWAEVVERSDALVLVVPEYNHSFPGELKLLLDSLYKEYTGIPVGVVGVSGGAIGGARVVDHLKPVLVELNMVAVKAAVLVPNVTDAVSDDGTFNNKETYTFIEGLISSLREHVAH